MKKVISVFLAALMLMACVSVSGLAAYDECTCTDGHVEVAGACTCCVYCEYADEGAWNTCYRDSGEFCCKDCDGIRPCGCDCECCTVNENIDDNKSNMDDYITEQDKKEFVDGFQAILKKVSDFFDMLFDTIFEFLKIDEILGKGDTPEA